MTAKDHPRREHKIIKWLNALPAGKEFLSREIAKDLDLMPAEVGSTLKCLSEVRISRQEWPIGTIWIKVLP